MTTKELLFEIAWNAGSETIKFFRDKPIGKWDGLRARRIYQHLSKSQKKFFIEVARSATAATRKSAARYL